MKPKHSIGSLLSVFKRKKKTSKAQKLKQVQHREPTTTSRNNVFVVKPSNSSAQLDISICPSTSGETTDSRTEVMSPTSVEVSLFTPTSNSDRSGKGKTPKTTNAKGSSKGIPYKGGHKDPLELTRRIIKDETKEDNTSRGPTELAIGYILRDLRQSMTVKQATPPMRMIYGMLNGVNTDKPIRKAAAKKIAKMNGIATIIMTVQKFFHEHEHEFSTLAIRCLIQLTRFYPDCKQNMADIGGAEAILKIAESHYDNVMVTANAVGLLCNLSTLSSTQKRVASERCIDFVVEAMRDYPAHRFIQRNGCAYLSCIGNIDGMQKVFREKKIDYLLLETFNSFQDRNDRAEENLFFHKCKEIQAFAKLGMVVYMSKIRENRSDH